MKRGPLEDLLNRIRATPVAVLGDFCLDAYWTFDPAGSEISLETGKPTHTVRGQRYDLGGAGNVVHNLIDLGVGQVQAIGVVGDDLFGREMKRMLAAIGADVAGLGVQDEHWDTPVYGKPYLDREEQSRIDFGAFNQLTPPTEQRLVENLLAVLPTVRVVILNQQLARGLNSPGLIDRLNCVIAEHPERIFLVDSRHQSEQYRGAILKVNAAEASRLCGVSRAIGEVVLLEEVRDYARRLFERSARPVFITRGARGLIICDHTGITEVPGIQILTPVDPVGAGDTTASAIAAALAAGAGPVAAAELANAAAAVVVRKLEQCGTATPAEIIEVGADPDYVNRPELADDPRRARYLPATEIELIGEEVVELGRIQHALFDHDGTISTLRQGWEAIMEPMMVKAVLGPRYAEADESHYGLVVQAVREYIDKSTGVQTLVQMEALVAMVRRFGYVPPDQMLDQLGYKAIYNETLMELVRARLAKLQQGELEVQDFTIKGAVAFLARLHERGVKLYLASGTDHEDVVAEATALGYAHLFGGRIYGAIGDITHNSKKEVVDRILQENRLTDVQLACFGDGPVELRETKKIGGIAVGIASDEVRRYGLNPEKRARLVRAGADLIVPDFSQGIELFDHLFRSSDR